jgi:hypothetical protein
MKVAFGAKPEAADLNHELLLSAETGHRLAVRSWFRIDPESTFVTAPMLRLAGALMTGERIVV